MSRLPTAVILANAPVSLTTPLWPKKCLWALSVIGLWQQQQQQQLKGEGTV